MVVVLAVLTVAADRNEDVGTATKNGRGGPVGGCCSAAFCMGLPPPAAQRQCRCGCGCSSGLNCSIAASQHRSIAAWRQLKFTDAEKGQSETPRC